MSIQIRQAQPGDIDTLVQLLQELFNIEQDFDCDMEKQRKGLELLLADQKNCCVLVVESLGKVIAMCSVQKLISTAEGKQVGIVEDLVVRTGERRKGIGQALLSAIEDWSHEHGMCRLQLLADQNNSSALDFYSKNGWSMTKLIGLRKLFY